MFVRNILFLTGLTLSMTVHAGDFIHRYFSELETFQANFTQHVVDSTGAEMQNSDGRVWIKRPGQFRWDYATPFKQELVANGEKLWTYDEDLEQATVRPVDEALSSTPAMLLSGYRPVSEVMDWKSVGTEGGLQWYELKPKKVDASVEMVRIAFQAGELAVIEVVDSFGNNTRIRFSDIRKNQPIDAKRFVFTPPPGTDVIGG